jgi:predicted secreted protein
MVASAARGSFGATFSIGSTAGTFLATSTVTLAAVAEILTITPPTYSANTVDVTNQNTTEFFKEALSGVRDPGSLSITANYLSTNTVHQTSLPFYFNNGQKMAWMITLAGTSSMNYFCGYGYITSYNWTSPPDGAVTFAATVKITGKPIGPVSGSSMI